MQCCLLCIPHGPILCFLPGVVTCCLKWLPSCQESWYLPGQMEQCWRCNPSNKRQIFFSHYLPPQPHHFCSEIKPSQKPRNWEKHLSHFTQSSWQPSYLLHQCKQERCLHNCMEKWKEPASLGSCVWQNEAPSALLETMESGKQQDESQDSGGGEKHRGREQL